MTKAGDRIKEGLQEALAIAKGEEPAASITVNGHVYVPKADYDELKHIYGVYMRQKKVSSDRADSRIAELESELAGCKIALEQAWESNRERLAENERLRAELKRANELLSGDEMVERAVLSAIAINELTAENERLHRLCKRHGVAPSSAELMEAAKEVGHGQPDV